MSTEIMIPQGFGAAPKVLSGVKVNNNEYGAGVAASYAIIGYKGKVWSIRHNGETNNLMRDDGDGPRASIEVVIVKASSAKAKNYYAGGYVEGSSAPPDCSSSNGVTPDAGVPKKQSNVCATCPMHAYGSRISESGQSGRACSESRRVAIVPLADIDNEAMGGPMLLRIPAGSLKDLKSYGETLQAIDHHVHGCATRISFEPNDAYPKFVFRPMRPLTNDEAIKILALRDDDRVQRILSEDTQAAAVLETATVAKSVFEQDDEAPAAQPVAKPAAVKIAPKAAPKVTPKVTPVAAKPAPVTPVAQEASTDDEAEIVMEDDENGDVTEQFDSMLDSLLPK